MSNFDLFVNFYKQFNSNNIYNFIRPLHIFPKNKLIIYKFPKTGGSGLFNLLKKLNLLDDKSYIYCKKDKYNFLKWLNSIKEEEFNNYKIITTIRNPTDKIISQINNISYLDVEKYFNNDLNYFLKDLLIKIIKYSNCNIKYDKTHLNKEYFNLDTNIYHCYPINLLIPSYNIFTNIYDVKNLDNNIFDILNFFNVKLSKQQLYDIYKYKNESKTKTYNKMNINEENQNTINILFKNDIEIYNNLFN